MDASRSPLASSRHGPPGWTINHHAGTSANLTCIARSGDADMEQGPSMGTFGRQPVRFHPIESAHPINQVYNTARNELLKMCQVLNWYMIGVRRIGWKPEARKNPAVLIIVANKMTESLVPKAEACVRNIVAHLQPYNVPDVEVHVACMMDRPGPLPQVRDGSDGLADSDTMRHSLSVRMPPPGTSVGVHGNIECGSLGPYVQITLGNGEKYYAAITAHHVIAPTSAEGIQPSWTMPPVVDCPARPDLLEYVNYVQMIADSCRSQVATIRCTLQAVEEGRREDAQRCERLDEQLQDAQHRHHTLLHTVNQAQQMAPNLELGHVFASSGIRQNGPTIPAQDWALIDLAPSRQEATVSSQIRVQIFQESQLARYMDRREAQHLLNALADVETPARAMTITMADVMMQEDDNMPLAILYGRTSGFTMGRVNGMCDEVIMKDSCGITISARLAVVVDCGTKAFSAKGDSGAAVYDRSGLVMGTLLRRVEETKSSYVLPIDDTLANMKARLGELGQDVREIEIV